MEIKRRTFQYIESEVYDYHETIKEIKLIQYEILQESSTFTDDPQAGRSSVMNITDVTADKATRLIEHKQLRRMTEITDAIRKTYNGLLEEKKELIKLYYWDRPGELTWDGVAKELCVSRATAIRWRRKFIYEIARELGER